MQFKDQARRSLGGSAQIRGGTLIFGQDIKLYRSTANTLSLGADDSLVIPGDTKSLTLALGTGGTKITSTGGGTIIFRNDNANLYWGANNQLKTDGNFTASGTITATAGVTTKEATGAVAVAVLTNSGDVQVQMCGGTPRILAMVAGTTYYANLT